MVDTISSSQAAAVQAKATDPANPSKEFSFFGDDGVSFWDVLDMVNPLQHIPVISTAYRSLTGDQIDPGSRLIGGTLLGGPIGLVASAANVALEHGTGKDAGNHVLAWFDDAEEVPSPNQPTYAQDETVPKPQNTTTQATIPLDPDVILAHEAAAFAAGEASLTQAAETAAQQAPIPPILQQASLRPATQAQPFAGSAGTWQPTSAQQTAFARQPFPTPEAEAKPRPLEESQAPTAKPAADSPFFKAQQSHQESLDALRAFARDLKTQHNQVPSQQRPEQQAATTATPQAPNPTHNPLASQDNDWFVQTITNTMSRYRDNSRPAG